MKILQVKQEWERKHVFQKKFDDVYGLIFLTDVFRSNSALILKAQEF